jgi:hypothetical protein
VIFFAPACLAWLSIAAFSFSFSTGPPKRDDATNRYNLDVLGHHRKRVIANDHLANIRGQLKVGWTTDHKRILEKLDRVWEAWLEEIYNAVYGTLHYRRR